MVRKIKHQERPSGNSSDLDYINVLQEYLLPYHAVVISSSRFEKTLGSCNKIDAECGLFCQRSS